MKVLSLFVLFLTQVQCKTYPAVNFQSDGYPSTDSFLVLNSSLPEMTEFTVCVHAKLFHARGGSVPLLSYAVGKFSDEIYLVLDIAKWSLKFMCCKGEGRYTSPPLSSSFSSMLVWLHLCVVVDLAKPEVIIYLNDHEEKGAIEIIGGSSRITTLAGGFLVLGQEQDFTLGGFTVAQSFEGYFAGYTLFNKAVKDDAIKKFLNCEDENIGTNNVIASFDNLSTGWYANGSTEKKEFSSEEVCQESNHIFSFFTESRSYESSFSLCKMLKGQIVVPQNENENNDLLNALTDHANMNIVKTCSVEYGTFMWLGIRAKNDTGNWLMVNDDNDEPITYSNFRPGYSHAHGNYKCVLLDSYELGFWVVYPCNMKACVTCSFNSVTELTLRGLCADSLIDNKYLLYGYFETKPKFEGIKHSKIIWKNNTWVVVDSLYDDVTAYMEMTELNQYPFGLRTWHIEGDICPKKSPELLLTSCRAHQYTCNDGTCIPKMQRCDLQVQCPDKSDERVCTTVVVPRDYIKEVPPARIGKDPASISLFVTILAMKPINTFTSMTSVQLLITLKWRDPRLDMESLNFAEEMNVIYDEDSLWIPQYVIEDDFGSETRNRLDWQTFVAVMESGPLDDDITRTKEDEVYPGLRNSLKLVRSYTLEFFCRMNFVAYPFDTQRCNIIIRLQEVRKDIVALRATGEGVEYLGPKSLREYRILGAKMVKNDIGNFSGHKITLILDNLSGFYVSSTYVPTFLMVMICYFTFFFHLDDFNDRIMVSLTALLVLATLFSQITQSTPSTAYLKLLDVWFVSCILIDFLIVVIHVVINYIRIQEEESDTRFTSVLSYKTTLNPPKEFRRSKNLNKKAIIITPIFVLMFCVGYITVSLIFFTK